MIRSWITPVTRNPAWRLECDPEDILHEALIAICEQIGRFTGQASLKTYVRTIAFNICVNHHRRNSWLTRVVEIEAIQIPTHNPGPLDELIRDELAEFHREALEVILANARPECMDLWIMRYWQRLSHEVIAGKLGIAVGTVKSRASRCRDKARAALKMPIN